MSKEVCLSRRQVAEMRTPGHLPKALIRRPPQLGFVSDLLASASLLDLFRAPGGFIRLRPTDCSLHSWQTVLSGKSFARYSGLAFETYYMLRRSASQRPMVSRYGGPPRENVARMKPVVMRLFQVVVQSEKTGPQATARGHAN